MKSKRLDGSIYGWMWMIGWCLLAFGSLTWAGFGLLQMGQLLGATPSGVGMIGLSAVATAALGLIVLGLRALLVPKT